MATSSARSRRARKVLDNTVLPISYLLTATPYMWLAIVLAYVFGSVTGLFPLSGAYAYDQQPGWSWDFIGSFLFHWILPFLSLFLVSLGGWAIGMRNMIIYELESDYSQYLASLGAPRSLIRRYAYRNAILPQVTGTDRDVLPRKALHALGEYDLALPEHDPQAAR